MADMIRLACAGALPDEGLIVPVPPHPARRRRTGVDHALVLARALARTVGLSVGRPLARLGPTKRQVGASRIERLSRDRIAVMAEGPVCGQVVLVDDVHTTGATFAACARVLRDAGASRVTCISFARALAAPGRQPGAAW